MTGALNISPDKNKVTHLCTKKSDSFVQQASLAWWAFARRDQNILAPSEQTCSGI
jgi:hypothetical protein